MLAEGGAPELALRLIGRQQPSLAVDPVAWELWERERFELLAANGGEQAVVERVARLPAATPAPFRDWAEGRRIDALLTLGRGADARQRLTRLIWANGEPAAPTRLAEWRRQLVRAYLLLGRADDAYRAMVRYQQDYGSGGGEWGLLQARVLLLAGRHQDAVAALAGERGDEARLMSALARLRGGEDAAAIASAAGVPAGPSTPDSLRQFALLLAAEGWQRAGDPRREIAALESLLQGASLDQGLGDLFPLEVDRLWQRWQALGERLGNEALLLIGQDQPWFDLGRASLTSDPLHARALFAALALTTRDPLFRISAHNELSRLLLAEPGGERLLRRLYLDSGRWPAYQQIPALVRYRLLDGALAEGDMRLASALMASLPRSPEGEAEWEWSLRRARVMILGGEVDNGIEVISRLIEASDAVGEEAGERLLQVLFDLQSVDRHREVIPLFAALAARIGSPRLRREILYWIGDSWRAVEEHEQAASHYLLSAGMVDPWSLDQWAQSARFAAASALADAGLAADARRIYQRLLAVTREPGRQALLRHRIQELWLVDGAAGGDEVVGAGR